MTFSLFQSDLCAAAVKKFSQSSKFLKIRTMSDKNVELRQSEMDERLEEFQNWLHTQPDLPQHLDEMLLRRYLKTYNFRLEKAQTLLKYSFGIRENNKHIFCDRDFLSTEIQNVFSLCEMVPMLKATPENYKCCIMRLIDSKTEKWNFNDVIKGFFMVADVRLVSPDPNPDMMADGEVPIFDMSGVSIWHLLKVNLSTLKLYFKYAQEAHPVRVQQIHVVNCTPLINRIMSLIKPLLKPEVAARFQFHTPGSETLYNFIPREMLPEEYGGDAGPIQDIKDFWVKRFLAKRDYIANDANWITTKAEDQNNNEKSCK